MEAIADLLEQGSGSRGSHLALDANGIELHPDIIDKSTGKPLRFKPENESLGNSSLQIKYDEKPPDLFSRKNV